MFSISVDFQIPFASIQLHLFSYKVVLCYSCTVVIVYMQVFGWATIKWNEQLLSLLKPLAEQNRESQVVSCRILSKIRLLQQ